MFSLFGLGLFALGLSCCAYRAIFQQCFWNWTRSDAATDVQFVLLLELKRVYSVMFPVLLSMDLADGTATIRLCIGDVKLSSAYLHWVCCAGIGLLRLQSRFPIILLKLEEKLMLLACYWSFCSAGTKESVLNDVLIFF